MSDINSAVGCPGAPPAPSCAFCLFGSAGDLAHRLLIPALYNLAAAGLLDDGFRLIGIDRQSGSDEEFASRVEAALRATAADDDGEFGKHKLAEDKIDWMKARMRHVRGDVTHADTYVELARAIGTADAIFYLALPPAFFAPVAEQLGGAGLLREADDAKGGKIFRRLVVEKPFGVDLSSARVLNAKLLQQCEESQIYRIDHFLGKETVQNILALRFANAWLEPIWNRHSIESVCIEALENLGVERRGSFYDAAGALRDMVPNHLFQLLAMVGMEPPGDFGAGALRRERCRVMDAVRVYPLRQAAANGMRAQYTAGRVHGAPLQAFRESPDVAPQSTTETFAALRLLIDNPRWSGVPFHLVTGKALGERRTRIVIRFKPAAAPIFAKTNATAPVPGGELVLHIQPDEGVDMQLAAKQPGPVPCLKSVNMRFRYADYFHAPPTTGYETLLYDCMTGDMTLFQRAEQIEAAWAAVQPFLDAWREDMSPLVFYAAGSDGPDLSALWETNAPAAEIPALLRHTTR